MHVLFVSHTAERMGAERSLLALVREAVQARGHRVTVLTPDAGPLGAELAGAGAMVVVLPTRLWMGRRYGLLAGAVRLAQALWSVPAYRRCIGRTRPDLVVTNSAAVPAGAVAARLAGVRHVWVVRESLLTNPSLRSVLPRPAIARTIARLSESVIAISPYVARQLLDAAPGVGDRLRVIAPPVAAPAPPLAPAPALAPASPLAPASSLMPASPLDRPALARLVLFGRYSAEKGQRDAIEALGICRRQGHPLRLRLVGVDGAAGRTIDQLARANGVADLVEITGWVDDPAPMYAWADATLMLSRNEAYGRVTVESLMCGTPVIGYRAGATTEILADGGGLLVEPGSGALATVLVRLATSAGSYRLVRQAADERAQRLRAAPSPAATFIDHLEHLVGSTG